MIGTQVKVENGVGKCRLAITNNIFLIAEGGLSTRAVAFLCAAELWVCTLDRSGSKDRIEVALE